ncbi:ATP-binding protein [Aeromicrobium ginsengisoli]|uniref:histidine kinase n=1 Tax=Aeromicrobium ginsengisoli TaxID=363867 RepID=A0A5M4FJW0_9ACTN|nr:ATP-binding protein [Aeromicrobium ginsengisoli]KAA1399895.1 HAMP domain-containing protein [Aeromicrobium ginsengisoli]
MSRERGRLSRLPLRVRLVAGFSATMLLVLTAAGAFVFWRVQYALDHRLNTELAKTARVVTPLVTSTGEISDDDALRAAGDHYQVLDRAGRVLTADKTAGQSPLLRPGEVRSALRHPVRKDLGELLPASARPLRVYAKALPPRAGGDAAVLVVATKRNQRDEALRELLGQLLAAGFGALIITAVVGDRLARAALKPVERYRSQAADIASGAMGVRLDVPAQRDDEVTRLGHTLNDVLSALEDALEHERRFVNDASHELRTPLTLLTSRVQLALRRQRSVSEHEVILEEIGTDVARLSRLAEQLLALGNEQSAPASTETSDLAAVTLRQIELRRSLATPDAPFSAPGALEVATSGPALVEVGATRLTRLIDNLLNNAAIHGAPPVTVTVDATDKVARLVVADAGPGMDPDLLGTATQRFARSPDARARPGSGLGLSLADSIVAAAGGQLRLCFGGHHNCFGAALDLECDHDDRMTFTVLLPLRHS